MLAFKARHIVICPSFWYPESHEEKPPSRPPKGSIMEWDICFLSKNSSIKLQKEKKTEGKEKGLKREEKHQERLFGEKKKSLCVSH